MTVIFNETNRMVVEFASLVGNEDHYPLSRESQIWLVCESDGLNAVPAWKAVSKINWAYAHFCDICQKQVVEAEFAERLVHGKALKAETYIAEWRKAIAAPVALSSLTVHGLTLVGSLSHATAGLNDKFEKGKDGRVRELLDSGFPRVQTDSLTTFSIPLIDVASCKLYYQSAGLWFDPAKYEVASSSAISVERATKVSLAAASNMTFDLFDTQGVTA